MSGVYGEGVESLRRVGGGMIITLYVCLICGNTSVFMIFSLVRMGGSVARFASGQSFYMDGENA